MNQAEFETRLSRLVCQAARENLRIEGCVARSPRPTVRDYDVEITELSKRTGGPGDHYTPWVPSE